MKEFVDNLFSPLYTFSLSPKGGSSQRGITLKALDQATCVLLNHQGSSVSDNIFQFEPIKDYIEPGCPHTQERPSTNLGTKPNSPHRLGTRQAEPRATSLLSRTHTVAHFLSTTSDSADCPCACTLFSSSLSSAARNRASHSARVRSLAPSPTSIMMSCRRIACSSCSGVPSPRHCSTLSLMRMGVPAGAASRPGTSARRMAVESASAQLWKTWRRKNAATALPPGCCGWKKSCCCSSMRLATAGSSLARTRRP